MSRSALAMKEALEAACPKRTRIYFEALKQFAREEGKGSKARPLTVEDIQAGKLRIDKLVETIAALDEKSPLPGPVVWSVGTLRDALKDADETMIFVVARPGRSAQKR